MWCKEATNQSWPHRWDSVTAPHKFLPRRNSSLTCIGWYPATDDTNMTFPPLKEKHRPVRGVRNITAGRFLWTPLLVPLSLTLSSPYEAPPAWSWGRLILRSHLGSENVDTVTVNTLTEWSQSDVNSSSEPHFGFMLLFYDNISVLLYPSFKKKKMLIYVVHHKWLVWAQFLYIPYPRPPLWSPWCFQRKDWLLHWTPGCQWPHTDPESVPNTEPSIRSCYYTVTPTSGGHFNRHVHFIS